MKEIQKGEKIYMYMYKKGIARFLPISLCLLALLLVACNSQPPPKNLVKLPPNQQVYIAPIIGATDITTFDPALVLTSDVASLSAIQMVFTGLVQLDDKLQVHPQLATSWELGTDGLSWTFHLKAHLKFSDGTPLTSKDVAYSIDRALQPATKSPIAPIYLGMIKDADVLLAGRLSSLINDSLLTPDANTLIILTKKPTPYFLTMLTYPCSYVVEKKLIDTYGADFVNHLTQGGGAGPFKLAAYAHGQELDFEPNTNYYNAIPQLRRVTFPFYQKPEDAYHAYLSNTVDTTAVPVSTFATDKKRNDFFQVPQLWINYYTMNYLVKPFDNVHIRQAFALAINKTAIVSTVWKGTVLPTNHIVPQGMPGYNAGLNGPDGTQSLTGNSSKAVQLLNMGIREEGWTTLSQFPAVKLTYISGSSLFDQEVASMIQMWQKVLGITVTADAVDFNMLLDEITAATNNPSGLQFWSFAWVAEYPDPYDWLTFQFGKDVLNNSMNYGQNTSSDVALQQQTQQTLESVDAQTDANTRFKNYAVSEQQLVNDVAWMPMEQVTLTFLRKTHVIGIVDNAQNLIPPDDWATIYIGEYR